VVESVENCIIIVVSSPLLRLHYIGRRNYNYCYCDRGHSRRSFNFIEEFIKILCFLHPINCANEVYCKIIIKWLYKLGCKWENKISKTSVEVMSKYNYVNACSKRAPSRDVNVEMLLPLSQLVS
jgi:hypothetical protein